MISKLLSVIKGFLIAPNMEIDKIFTTVLKKLLKERKTDAESYLKEICERRKQRNGTDDMFINSLDKYLKTEFEDNIRGDSFDNEFPQITAEYYNDRCKSEELNSCDIDSVCEHIHHDIDILGELLLKAAIPAIQIDKAFVYYVVRSIENIINSIEPENTETDDTINAPEYRFGDFVIQNTSKIACGQLADIEVEEKKRRLRIEMCSEIQTILNDIKKFDINEVSV
jgi:hypothetical protein